MAELLMEVIYMIKEKKINENYTFVRFLKGHADEKKLDNQFKTLHNKYFKDFDCSKCLKCCKELKVSFSQEEIEKSAKTLNQSVNDFIQKYLEFDTLEQKYYTKVTPCPFLKDEKCQLSKCKPKECIEYPYTNKPNRIHHLYSIIDNAETCPVVAKILEELKEIYNFKR